MCDKNNYSIVHCHSPIGGVIARFACREARKKGTKVIYTAHGFHFYKGAPIKNWLIYYLVERIAAKYTDVLITINKEDFKNCQKFKTNKIVYVPGIGIDVNKIRNTKTDRKLKRKELGLNEDDYVLITAGELSRRKNHEVLIKALAEIKNKNVKLLICGLGELEDYLRNLVSDFRLEDRVILAGYRRDVIELLYASDCFVFPSLQEGLPVALMEAMAAGLPIVCSKIRGNVDLIRHGVNGFLAEPDNIAGFAECIRNIMESNRLQREMSRKNLEDSRKYDKAVVRDKCIKYTAI
ncbi:MAG: glycosyltransferase family 4 protein [Caldicoprobacterales bacterium]